MSNIPHLQEAIEKCLVNTFGKLSVPLDKQVMEIKRISDIPKIAQQIRLLRFGPKLKINGEYITTQFQAGFHGLSQDEDNAVASKYVEALFIKIGKSSYPEIWGFLKEKSMNNMLKLLTVMEKEKSKNDLSLLDTSEMIDRMISGASGYILAVKPYRQINRVNRRVFSKNNLDPFAVKYSNNIKSPVKDIHRGIYSFSDSEKVNNDVGRFCSDILKIAEPGFSNRVLAILFLAESFRYPPMLFYSLLVIHCYMNGCVSGEELENGFHPSQRNKSQQNQFFSYAEKSGYTLEQLLATQEEIEDFRKSNEAILNRLYENIEMLLVKKLQRK